MKLAQLEADRRTLVERAKAIIDGDSELTDAERAELAELRAKIETRDTDIETLRKVDSYQSAKDAPKDSTDNRQAHRMTQFSITRAVRDAMGWGTDDAGFEREVMAELRRSGTFEGIPVPLEALSKRAPTVAGTDAQGGFLIADDHRPEMYIDALRDALITDRLGVTTISGLTGNPQIPQANAVTSLGWATETGAFTETTPTFLQKTMSPRKAGAWSEWTQQLVLQSAPGIEGLVRADLAATVARGIDNVVIYGGTGQEPNGVTASITNRARAGDANGQALTFAQLVDLQAGLDEANAPMDSRAWLLANRTKNSLKNLPRFATDGDRAAELAYMNGNILDDRAVISEGISTAVTHGSSGVTTSIFYANWSDLIVGYWQGLDLMLNPYADTSFKRGSILIRAMLFADVLIRRDESFAYYDAIIP